MTIDVVNCQEPIVFIRLQTQHSVFVVRVDQITLIEVGKRNIIVEWSQGKIDVPREAHGTDNAQTIADLIGKEIEPPVSVGEGE